MKAVGDAVDRDTGGVDGDVSGAAGVDAVGNVDSDGDSGGGGDCADRQVDKDCDGKISRGQTDPDLYPSWSATGKLFNL